MEGRHKTNERDARGVAMLLRNGTLPVVWIPPAELRDQREMLRWRMCLSRMRTRVKNRIHGVLQRYNVDIAASDLFGDVGRPELLARVHELPPYSAHSVVQQLQTVDAVETQIGECELVLEEILYPSLSRDLLDSLPCVGKILSAVMALEIGDVGRFKGPDHLLSYAGVVPVARESADWKRKDRCPRDCNIYLKWAYVEAANLISMHRGRWPERHVAQLYERVKQSTKMHGKAPGRRPSSGRGLLLDVDQARSLSRAEFQTESSFVDARVSATAPWPPRPICECETRLAELEIMPNDDGVCMVCGRKNTAGSDIDEQYSRMGFA